MTTNIIFANNLEIDATIQQEWLDILYMARSNAYSYLSSFRNDAGYTQKLETAFGADFNVGVANELFDGFAQGNFNAVPTIEIVNRDDINGANGAFAIATGKIYLAADFISQNAQNPDAIVAVLLEETGHFIDAQINVRDAAGDEGDIFARLVQGESISASELAVLRVEDDTVTVTLDDEVIQIEQVSTTPPLDVKVYISNISASEKDGAKITFGYEVGSLGGGTILTNGIEVKYDYYVSNTNVSTAGTFILKSSQENILTLPITDDQIYDFNRTFTFNLKESSTTTYNVKLDTTNPDKSSRTLTIIDNEPLISIEKNLDLTEGNGNGEFTINLDKTPPQNFDLDFKVEGTAKLGEYVATKKGSDYKLTYQGYNSSGAIDTFKGTLSPSDSNINGVYSIKNIPSDKNITQIKITVEQVNDEVWEQGETVNITLLDKYTPQLFIRRSEIVTASGDNLPNEGKDKAFDNNQNTKWLVFANQGNLGVQFDNNQGYIVTEYEITSANDVEARDPKTWILQGSNNGSNWTNLDSRNNETFSSRFQARNFTVNNSASYRYYRLNITANNGANQTQLADLKLKILKNDRYGVNSTQNTATVTITDNEPTVTLGKVVNPTEGFGFGSTIEGLGAALNLNGSNSVTIPSNNSLNLTQTGQFTQEAWIFANFTDNTQRGILGSDNYPSIWVENKTTIKVGIGNKTFSVTNALNPSSWNHVATTFDGKEYKLYVNGVELVKDTTFTGTNISAIQQLNIGKVGTNDNFVGAIDEVRLWNVARTQAEIQSYMLNPLKGSEEGLIGYWQFEGNTNDTSSNNNGLLATTETGKDIKSYLIDNPAPQIGYVEVNLDKPFEGPQGLWVEYDIYPGTETQNIDYFNSRTRRVSTDIKTERNGIIIPKGETSARIYVSALSDAVVEGDENLTITLRPTNFDIFDANNDGNYVGTEWALKFDGVDDYVATTKSLMNNLSAFTMEGWVKADSIPITGLNSLFGQNDVIEFGFSSQKLSVWTRNGGSLTADISYPLNEWHHVAVVGNGQNVILYLDGVEVKKGGSATTNYGTSTDTFKIGGGVWSTEITNQFKGQIADVRIWNVARSQQDIQNNKNQLFKGNETGLVGYYKRHESVAQTLLDLTATKNNGTLQNGTAWTPYKDSVEYAPSFENNPNFPTNNDGVLSQAERDAIGYNYKVGTDSTATITIKDNQAYQKGVILLDEYGQEVSSTNKLIVGKDGKVTFQVKLTSQPTSAVTLTLTSGLGTLNTTSVTIQPSAWDTPQSVTLNGVTGTNVTNNITVSVPNYLTTNVAFPFTNTPSDKVRITEGSTDAIAVTPVVTINKLNDVNEGDIQPGQFVINLNAPAPAAGLSVQYQLTGSAIAGTDYTSINVINIAPGETSAVIPIYSINDDIAEGNEQVTITLLNPATGYTLGSQTTATLNIIDDDKAGITLSDAVVSDTVTTYTGNFDSLVTSEPYPRNGDILQLFDQQTGNPVKEITLTQTVIDSGKVNISGISANSTLKAILKESSNAKGSVNIGTVTVKSDGTVDVTLPKNENTDTFGVRLSSKPTADVTITFDNIDSTEATFSKSSLTFTTANWDQYQSVTVTGLDDPATETNKVDGDIKYIVTAKATSTDAKYNNVSTSIAITNLDDDDNVIKTSITNSSTGTNLPKASIAPITTTEITEGNPINLTVNLSQAAGTGGTLVFYSVDGKDFKYGEDYTVPAANQVYLKETTDGVELTPTDITQLSGTKENKDLDGDGDLDLVVTNGTTKTNYYQFQAVKIAQGQSSATITVNTIDDKVDETDETVKIVLKAGTNYQVDDSATNKFVANSTVKDNDTAGITITPNQTQTSTSENSSFLTYTVQLNSQPTKPVTVYIGSNDASEGKITTPIALSFDGVDDYVSVANRSSLNITEEITIEAWVNLADSAKNQKIIGKTPVGSGYLIGVVNGKLNPEFWDSQGNRNTFESGQIPSNQWTHIAVTWKKGGSMIGYINGIEVGRTTASSNPLGSNTGELRIGVAPWDINAFKVNGAINEVRIWNVARNQQDIQNNKNLLLNGNESGLVAYYKANEGSGTTLIDSTVNKSNGILQGGTSWTQTNSEPSEFISRTFNADNWNTPQTFQVVGINDAIADGTVPYDVITTVTSEDPNYNKLAIAPISLTNTEDTDTAKIIITPPGQVVEGRQNVYSVKLNSQPVGEIRVIMTPKTDQFQLNNQDIGEPLTLTFNTTNWNQEQTVRVTALDDSVVEYFHTSQIEFKVETGNVKNFESKWQNNTPDQALDLGKITGGIERTDLTIDSSTSRDIDWYKFTLPTQGTAKDFVEIQFANAKGDLNLELYQISNSTTAVKTSLSTTTDKERIELNGLKAGDYLLNVSGNNSTTSNDYKLILGDADYQYRSAPIVTKDGKPLTALDVTIKDNDLPTAKIIAGPTASEVFAQPSYFTVQLNAPAPLDGNGIVVRYQVVGGSATLFEDINNNGILDAGEDFNGNNKLDFGDYRIQNNQKEGTVRIAPGEIQANIIVSPVDDKLVEDVEWKITKKVEGSTTNGKTTLNLDVNSPINGKVTKLFKNQTIKFGDSIEGTLQKDVQLEEYLAPVTLTKIAAINSLKTGGVASVSEDGRYVVIVSTDSLVSNDKNGQNDVFLVDTVTNNITRVSIGLTGQDTNGFSDNTQISADGRYISYVSGASNIVSGDTNQLWDIFVYDTVTKQNTRVNLTSTGAQATGGNSYGARISGDGNYIAFLSNASNLDVDGTADAFVYNRQTGQVSVVSKNSSGTKSNEQTYDINISAYGGFVVFASNGNNLVSGDTNSKGDIFVHEILTGKTTRVNVSSNGTQATDSGSSPSISGDGRYVIFESDANNLVSADTNNAKDVFIHDRQTGNTSLISLSSDGIQGNAASSAGSISGDGRYVLFRSNASNLVINDNNNVEDIFLRDRQTGDTVRVSLDSKVSLNGEPISDNGNINLIKGGRISPDGRTIFLLDNTGQLYVGKIENKARETIEVTLDSTLKDRVAVNSVAKMTAETVTVELLPDANTTNPTYTLGGEDVNLNGKLDLSEDTNGNGKLDPNGNTSKATLSILDDDVPGIRIVEVGNHTVVREKETATFEVSLLSEPKNTVTIKLTPGAEIEFVNPINPTNVQVDKDVYKSIP